MTTFANDNGLSPEAQGTAKGRGRLAGRRILVVGAGQRTHGIKDAPMGNGRAMSMLFGREGALVAAADRNRTAVEETVQLVKGEGATAFSIIADAAKEAQVKEMIQQAVELMGGLDGLVLNVGKGEGYTLEHTSVEQWENVFNVNVLAHFLGCKYGLPVMSPGGSIVLISSVAAQMGSGEVPAYSSSKAALSGLCIYVAREAAPKRVRVNMVVPGIIDTPLGRQVTQERPSRAGTEIPLGRQGTAWEVAYAATFLLSNEASYTTGQSIVVDGGLLAIR